MGYVRDFHRTGVGWVGSVIKTKREKLRETQRERETETERQINRHTDRDRERKTETE